MSSKYQLFPILSKYFVSYTYCYINILSCDEFQSQKHYRWVDQNIYDLQVLQFSFFFLRTILGLKWYYQA